MPLLILKSVVMACLMVLGTGRAAAQDPAAVPAAVPVPCADAPCELIFDWGPGRTAGSFGNDRRYGSGEDFETGVRRSLLAHGVQISAVETGSLTITLRPRVYPRAMCDAVAGTGTRFSCPVVSDVAISFTSADAALKPPGAQRLTNRCGSERVFLTMGQFGQYVGEMIWFSISPASVKERRPALRC